MEKLVKKVRHLIVFSVFILLGIVVVGGEILYLNNHRLGNVLGVFAENNFEMLLIGSEKDAGNGIKIEGKIEADDARPVIIKKYLEKYNSPLVPYSDLIFEVSRAYNFEYYWIVAIAQQESNLCKKAPEDSHNCWGYGIHKRGTLKFDNYELAIKSYAEYLKTEYFDKNLNTPELIMSKYCPSSNGSWAKGVQQFIDEMESGTF
jgi:hypothetical protein